MRGWLVETARRQAAGSVGPTAHNANMAGRHLLIWTVQQGRPLYQASGPAIYTAGVTPSGGYSLSNPGPVTHDQRRQPSAVLR